MSPHEKTISGKELIIDETKDRMKDPERRTLMGETKAAEVRKSNKESEVI